MNCIPLVPVRVLLACGFLTISAGCVEPPPKPVPVSGMINLNGKPLTKGLLSFVPGTADGAVRPSTAVIQADGSYKTSTFKDGDGLLPGTYKIVVTSDAQSLTAEEMAAGKKAVSVVPKIYTSLTTTPLSLEIAPDATPIEHDIDLSDK